MGDKQRGLPLGRCAPLAAVAGMLSFSLCDVAGAAGPGVPSLGDTPGAYEDYADNNLPAWFRTPRLQAADNTPADNAITDHGAELGRVLFYDARLSHNNGTACASCHVQENGFDDPNALSEGFEGGLTGRHSMALSNSRFYEPGSFFWDERASTLEEQVLMPIQDAVEMGSTLAGPDGLVAELQATEYYPVLFQRAFDDSTVTSERMAAAMAQFVRSMVSYQSKYDVARAAGPAGSAAFNAELTAEELRGHAVFAGSCAACHTTDAQVAPSANNIGLDADNSADAGNEDGEFKAPSLRNVAVRGAFMHDGRFSTLEEVIEHYSSGVLNNPSLGRLQVGGINLTEQEKADLVAFLHTLTDQTFLSSELFSNPFVELPGDYNADGVVDSDDYAAWRSSVGISASEVSGPLLADGNNDGLVDASDYAVWRENLGARWDDAIAALSQAATAAPEPASAGLALLAISVAMATCSRRRSPQPFRSGDRRLGDRGS